MSTKPLTNVIIKDGKIIRKRTFLAGKKERDAARLAKRWENARVKKLREVYGAREASLQDQAEKAGRKT